MPYPKNEEEKSGKIVIISSIASFRPIAYHGGYSSSKAAVRMIADSWRMALKKYDYTVNFNMSRVYSK